ncbi:hypothetical protein A4X09_0g329 [Tilletia walkeri]|uniref:Uncharacterized protein n=1 Tax=Tilletia walkeri TaxID=117179 RepID=A0A8X7NHG7_9BASI|nr:hypothetical protein A4X09_0g329 [Tilletia walkeri]
MCCKFLTGGDPNGADSTPPKYVPLHPLIISRLDIIDADIVAEQDRQLWNKSAKATARRAAAQKAVGPSDPLPDIPKRITSSSTGDSSRIPNQGNDAHYNDDVVALNAVDDGADDVALDDVDDNADDHGNYENDREKKKRPLRVYHDVIRLNKKLSKSGRQRRNRRIRSLMEGNAQVKAQILAMVEHIPALGTFFANAIDDVDQTLLEYQRSPHPKSAPKHPTLSLQRPTQHSYLPVSATIQTSANPLVFTPGAFQYRVPRFDDVRSSEALTNVPQG